MDLAGLKKIADENGVEYNKFWGADKMQEALIDAGVEFEIMEVPSEREQAEPKPVVEAEPVAPKAKSGSVTCVVLCSNVHVQNRDLGRHDNGASQKFLRGDKFTITNIDVARSMEARKQVAIV